MRHPVVLSERPLPEQPSGNHFPTDDELFRSCGAELMTSPNSMNIAIAGTMVRTAMNIALSYSGYCRIKPPNARPSPDSHMTHLSPHTAAGVTNPATARCQ